MRIHKFIYNLGFKDILESYFPVYNLTDSINEYFNY